MIDIGAWRGATHQVHCVHDWWIGAVGFGMGRCGLLALEAIDPDDVRRGTEIPQVHGARALGQAQRRLRPQPAGPLPLPIHEQDPRSGGRWLEDFEPDEPKHDAFTGSAPRPRCGLPRPFRLPAGTRRGPCPLPDGRVLIVRDLSPTKRCSTGATSATTRTCPLLDAVLRRSTPRRSASTEIESTTSRRPSPAEERRLLHHGRRRLHPREVEHADGRGPSGRLTTSGPELRGSAGKR